MVNNAMESKVLKKREDIQEIDKWSVNEVYSSDEVWEKEYKELKEEAPKLKWFEGKCRGNSQSTRKDCQGKRHPCHRVY